MATDDDLTYWQNMSVEAKAGRLSLDPVLAKIYSEACDKLIDGLVDVRQKMQLAAQVDGIGGFNCSAELRDGLRKLAVGGEGSMSHSLDRYMAVADLINQSVSESIAKTVDNDQGNAQGLGAIRPGA